MNYGNLQHCFQYCRSTLNSIIPLTVSPILLFLFQFFYWCVFYFHNLVSLFSLLLCTPTVKFSIFILSVSLLLLSKFLLFYSSIPVFIISVPVPSFCSQKDSLLLFSPFACGSASWRHLRDGTRIRRFGLAFRRSCFSRSSCIPSTANLAWLSTQLYSSQNSNPQTLFHVCLQFTCRSSTCSVLPLLFRGYFPLLTFPNPNFPGSPSKRVCFTRRHLGLSLKCSILIYIYLFN